MHNQNDTAASYGMSLLSALYPSQSTSTTGNSVTNNQPAVECPVFPAAPLAVEAEEQEGGEEEILCTKVLNDLAKRYFTVIAPAGEPVQITQQQIDQLLGFYGATASRALRFKALVESLEAGK